MPVLRVEPSRNKIYSSTLRIAAMSAGLAIAAIPQAFAQTTTNALNTAPGKLVIPSTSVVRAEDRGIRAHTNIRMIVHEGMKPMEAPPYSGYGYETPASLACIYRLVQPVRSCNPNDTVNTASGGSETIAIVDAYHDPSAASDLQYFSNQFGLPYVASKFNVVYSGGTQPATDSSGGWELEESLDIEYAHAMAPHATIYLVETPSNSFDDLFTGVIAATNLVHCGNMNSCPASAKGKGEVSMSWGGAEFSQEAEFDQFLVGKDIVFVASAGDSSGVSYPSASPNVVSAGGTTTARSLQNGNLIQEIAWSDAGGGASYYEPRPSYQAAIADYAGPSRATPDISSDANPNTGVWIYDSNPYEGEDNPSNWWTVGGTSVAAPTIAGILNAAATASGKFAASTSDELTQVYSDIANPASYSSSFWDITYGACNYYSGTFTRGGYDFCTGVGSPKGLSGK